MRSHSSPETVHLLELCDAWSAGRATDAEVRDAVRARALQAQQARGGFVASAGEQADTARGQAVCRAFDGYLSALAAIGKCRENAMPVAAKTLNRASSELFWAFQGYFAQFPPEGPTPYVSLNALLAVADRVASGDEAARTELTATAAEARAWFDRCLDEMQDPPPGEPLEALSRVAEGLRGCRDGVVEIEHDLDGSVAKIHDGLAVVADGWDMYAAQKSTGPTSSTVTNTYLQAAEAVGRGAYSIDLFVEGLDRLDASLATRAQETLVTEAAHRSSPSVQALVRQVRDGVRLQSEATAVWRRYAELREPALLAQGRSAMIDGARLLDEAEVALEAALAHVGKTVCTHCGTANPVHERFCGGCNAALSRFAQDDAEASSFSITEGGTVDAGHGPVLTENLKRLADATDAVAEGQISAEEFISTLDWMEGLLARAEAQQRHLPPPSEVPEELGGTIALVRSTEELFAEGIQQMRHGLDQLRAYPEDGDRQHLVDGLRTAFEGSQAIYRAGRVGDMIVADLPDEEAEPTEEPA